MENKVFDKAEEFIADKIKINTAAISVTANSINTAQANKEKAEKQAEKALWMNTKRHKRPLRKQTLQSLFIATC